MQLSQTYAEACHRLRLTSFGDDEVENRKGLDTILTFVRGEQIWPEDPLSCWTGRIWDGRLPDRKRSLEDIAQCFLPIFSPAIVLPPAKSHPLNSSVNRDIVETVLDLINDERWDKNKVLMSSRGRVFHVLLELILPPPEIVQAPKNFIGEDLKLWGKKVVDSVIKWIVESRPALQFFSQVDRPVVFDILLMLVTHFPEEFLEMWRSLPISRTGDDSLLGFLINLAEQEKNASVLYFVFPLFYVTLIKFLGPLTPREDRERVVEWLMPFYPLRFRGSPVIRRDTKTIEKMIMHGVRAAVLPWCETSGRTNPTATVPMLLESLLACEPLSEWTRKQLYDIIIVDIDDLSSITVAPVDQDSLARFDDFIDILRLANSLGSISVSSKQFDRLLDNKFFVTSCPKILLNEVWKLAGRNFFPKSPSAEVFEMVEIGDEETFVWLRKLTSRLEVDLPNIRVVTKTQISAAPLVAAVMSSCKSPNFLAAVCNSMTFDPNEVERISRAVPRLQVCGLEVAGILGALRGDVIDVSVWDPGTRSDMIRYEIGSDLTEMGGNRAVDELRGEELSQMIMLALSRWDRENRKDDGDFVNWTGPLRAEARACFLKRSVMVERDATAQLTRDLALESLTAEQDRVNVVHAYSLERRMRAREDSVALTRWADRLARERDEFLLLSFKEMFKKGPSSALLHVARQGDVSQLLEFAMGAFLSGHTGFSVPEQAFVAVHRSLSSDCRSVLWPLIDSFVMEMH